MSRVSRFRDCLVRGHLHEELFQRRVLQADLPQGPAAGLYGPRDLFADVVALLRAAGDGDVRLAVVAAATIEQLDLADAADVRQGALDIFGRSTTFDQHAGG